MSVNKELQELKILVASHQATVNEWMKTTIEYRKNLYDKIDKINNALGNLPCKERYGWYSSINKQIKFIWGVTGAIGIAIVLDWLKEKK